MISLLFVFSDMAHLAYGNVVNSVTYGVTGFAGK